MLITAHIEGSSEWKVLKVFSRWSHKLLVIILRENIKVSHLLLLRMDLPFNIPMAMNEDESFVTLYWLISFNRLSAFSSHVSSFTCSILIFVIFNQKQGKLFLSTTSFTFPYGFLWNSFLFTKKKEEKLWTFLCVFIYICFHLTFFLNTQLFSLFTKKTRINCPSWPIDHPTTGKGHYALLLNSKNYPTNDRTSTSQIRTRFRTNRIQ